jgi:hypothetical protein
MQSKNQTCKQNDARMSALQKSTCDVKIAVAFSYKIILEEGRRMPKAPTKIEGKQEHGVEKKTTDMSAQ